MPSNDRDSLEARTRTWREFCDAADASADGRHEQSIGLVARHPIVRGELQAFVKALKKGTISKTGPYTYENCRKS